MKDNLLIFSYDFPPSNGGIARLCYEIAQGVNYRYNKVIVLTREKKGVKLPYGEKVFQIKYLPSKRVLCELTALWYLLTLNNKKNFNVLCAIWHPEALLLLLTGFKNVNVLAHGAELLVGNSRFRKHFWINMYAKLILKRVNVIANSKYTKGLVKNIVSKGKVIALPLAVNHNFFKPIEKIKKIEKIIFGTVSRVLQFKGHDFILNVIKNLPKSVLSKVEWHIAGTGSYLAELKENVKELSLDKVVKFHGFVPDNDLPGFYSSLNCFILCTRQTEISINVEGFGLVFLEAQSCGVPVIGTKSGGVSCAVKPLNGGWLIEQDNEFELNALFVDLVSNPEIMKKQGELARSRVILEYTWDKYCEKLVEIIE